jgi:hydrogenase/urease accessory protein HupE
VLLTPAIAGAHMGSAKFVSAEVTDRGAALEVNVESVDAALALGLGTSIDPAELNQHAPLLRAWLARGLELRDDAGPCTPHAGPPRLTERDAKPYVTIPIDYACTTGAALVLRDTTVFDDDPDHEVFVAVGSRAHVLRAGAQEIELSTTPAVTDTAAAFLHEGAVHLVTGYDHLLFLLSLILVAGLAVRRDGLRIAARDVAWVVTAFTVGHSISLVAATLGVLTLPSAFVEVAIAASIVYVAVLNILRPDAPTNTTRRSRAILAAAFGLVHGFGFSSVLGEVGLPIRDRLVALASFNVGIELAQLAFVAAVLLPLAALARHPGTYRRVAVQGGSFAIAAFGAVWLVERSLGL